MNPKIFLSQLSHEDILKLSVEEMQERILIEQEFLNKQVHTKFVVATHGSKTKNGGLVNATINKAMKSEGHLIAAVGDEVVYEDGTRSKIISGAGENNKVGGFELAIVGSRLENDDEIIESLQSAFCNSFICGSSNF